MEESEAQVTLSEDMIIDQEKKRNTQSVRRFDNWHKRGLALFWKIS
jgi:hypothetical protein